MAHQAASSSMPVSPVSSFFFIGAKRMSQGQATATMNGMLPNSNGQAESTFEAKKWFERQQ